MWLHLRYVLRPQILAPPDPCADILMRNMRDDDACKPCHSQPFYDRREILSNRYTVPRYTQRRVAISTADAVGHDRCRQMTSAL